jgi:hypothetical protein
MSEQITEYKYEVGQLVCILKTAQAGHNGRIASRSISAHGRVAYAVNGWEFGEEELEAIQRYRVEKHDPYGYQIIDSTGKDEPYIISLARNSEQEIAELDGRFTNDPDFSYGDYEFELETNFKRVTTDLTARFGEDTTFIHHHDPAYMSKEALARMEAHALKTAQEWCNTWNSVESGHCGSCQKLFAEGESRYPAGGYNHLYRTICLACACSQED